MFLDLVVKAKKKFKGECLRLQRKHSLFSGKAR
jgi:hypothetical protein